MARGRAVAPRARNAGPPPRTHEVQSSDHADNLNRAAYEEHRLRQVQADRETARRLQDLGIDL